MNKQEFLTQLRKGLSNLSQHDTDERLTFYSEMIDDRMEEGLSEEEAVCEIGNIDDLISQIIAEIPITKAKEKKQIKKRLSALEIILLILGSPIWLSLVIATFLVILSLYSVLWSIIISLWAIFGSFIVCSFAGIIAGICFAFTGNTFPGIAIIGAGILCSGLSIFMYYACKLITKGTLSLTKNFALTIKNFFVKKEEA